MASYPLPNLQTHITAQSIKLTFRNEKDTSKYISLSIADYLYSVKQRINNHLSDWDNIKKITNPYEYIHTNISVGKYSISKIKPMSRAFFKLKIVRRVTISRRCEINASRTCFKFSSFG